MPGTPPTWTSPGCGTPFTPTSSPLCPRASTRETDIINQCCVTVHSCARAGVAGCRAPRLPGPAPAVAHPSRQLHRRSALERPPEPDISNQC